MKTHVLNKLCEDFEIISSFYSNCVRVPVHASLPLATCILHRGHSDGRIAPIFPIITLTTANFVKNFLFVELNLALDIVIDGVVEIVYAVDTRADDEEVHQEQNVPRNDHGRPSAKIDFSILINNCRSI